MKISSGGDAVTITQAECIEYAKDFRQLGMAANISMQRATVLMAISRSWTTLAGQLGRLDAVETEEYSNANSGLQDSVSTMVRGNQ